MKTKPFFTKRLLHASGFTLIEILVVVAIIGILGTAVLANTAESRIAAKEAAIIEETRQLMNYGFLIYNQERSYSDLQRAYISDCASEFDSGGFISELVRICESIQAKGGELFSGAVFDGGFGYSSYTFMPDAHSFIVRLPSAPNKYFCISSSGSTFTGVLGDDPDPSAPGGMTDAIYDPPHPPGCPFNP